MGAVVIKKRQAKNGPRYDVRWRAPDGTMRNKTFRTKAEALDYESEQRTARNRGTWIDPRHARVDIFEPYAEKWLAERPDLRPRTVELYESLLRCHIVPKFGALPLGKITTSAIRSWNAELKGRHPVTAAKAYRLLKLIMGTAVADDRIGRNPCTVKGAGQERSPERPMLSIGEVDALAAAMPQPWRIAVELAAWCQLRRGEILGLERRDVDVLHGTIRVERTANQMPGGFVIGPPKTDAGVRTVGVPPHVLASLESHLDEFVSADPSAPILAGPDGERLRPESLQGAWVAARTELCRPELHFHDLRHAGLTWIATQGATTAELMRRAGHASPAAALRYQHATDDRDAALAAALSGLAETRKVTSIRDRARDERAMKTG